MPERASDRAHGMGALTRTPVPRTRRRPFRYVWHCWTAHDTTDRGPWEAGRRSVGRCSRGINSTGSNNGVRPLGQSELLRLSRDCTTCKVPRSYYSATHERSAMSAPALDCTFSPRSVRRVTRTLAPATRASVNHLWLYLSNGSEQARIRTWLQRGHKRIGCSDVAAIG